LTQWDCPNANLSSSVITSQLEPKNVDVLKGEKEKEITQPKPDTKQTPRENKSVVIGLMK
jgi:hypothetical protein